MIKILLSVSILLTSSVFAGQKVDDSKKVKSKGVVEIANVSGKILLEGWKKNQVSVKGELGDQAEGFKFETKGNVTRFEVEMPDSNYTTKSGDDLVIRVPYGHKVDMQGVSTDFIIKNLKAGIEVESVSGDLTASGIEAGASLETVSGDVTIEKASGKLKLETVSGNIEGKVSSEVVKAEVVSGNIDLTLGSFRELTAESVSGNVHVKGEQLDNGSSKFSNVSGSINVTFTNKVNARLKASTGPGGNIVNNISDDEVQKDFPSQQRIKMTLGDGSGRIKLETVVGNIKINGK